MPSWSYWVPRLEGVVSRGRSMGWRAGDPGLHTALWPACVWPCVTHSPLLGCQFLLVNWRGSFPTPGESWVFPGTWAWPLGWHTALASTLPPCCPGSSSPTRGKAPELTGSKGLTEANQVLPGSFQEFHSLFVSALFHKQQGQLQQGVWDQVVVIFNLLFTVGQERTRLTGSAFETSFRLLLSSLPQTGESTPCPPVDFPDRNSNLGRFPLPSPRKAWDPQQRFPGLCTWDPNSLTAYGSCHTLSPPPPQSPTPFFQDEWFITLGSLLSLIWPLWPTTPCCPGDILLKSSSALLKSPAW